MLLDRGRGALTLQLLDVAGDVHRLDASQLGNSALLAPAQELAGSSRVGSPRIGVTDVDGEEFEEAPGSSLPCLADNVGYLQGGRLCDCHLSHAGSSPGNGSGRRAFSLFARA